MTALPRAVRPSRIEIDEAVLDVTAGLIARRGIRDTAVQAVADATGYSKAGILNRFPSKDLLVAAAVDQCLRQTEAALAEVDPLPPGPERDTAAIAALTDLALARPGWVELVLAALSEGRDDDVRGRIAPVADAMLRMFAADGASLDRRARIVGAVGAIAVLALTYRPDATIEQAAGLIRVVSADALGR